MKPNVNLLGFMAIGLALSGCSAEEKEKSRYIDTSLPDDAGDEGPGDGDPAPDAGPGPGMGAPDAGTTPSGDAAMPPPAPCGGACAPTDTCNPSTNMCEPPKSCPCQVGNHCDTGTNTCLPGCVTDGDCAQGATCNTANGQCEAPGPCAGTLVPGLTITKVAVNQAVQVPLFQNGQAVAVSARPAPIVQNRGALFRISVTPAAGYKPGDVITELTLDNAGVKKILRARGVISAGSDESTLEGTVNILAEAALIGPDTQVSIALTQNECATTPGTGRFPATGSAALGAIKTGRFKVVVVPYERAPGKLNLNDKTIQAIKDHLYSFYPTEGIDLEIHAPVVVTSAQTDLQRVLQNVRSLRAQEDPADDTYYYGFFTAARTFREFCSNGCVAGIATLGGNGTFGSPQDRYGVGVGYLTDTMTTSSGVPTTEINVSLNVMVHELGHSQGRQHGPCGGPAGIDPNFPNRTADIDTYGYNLVTGAYAQPKVAKDIMAYCEPNWISAYTYAAIARRIQGVNQTMLVRYGEPVEYASVIVEDDGDYFWGDNVKLREEPSGTPAWAKAFDATGALLDDKVEITLTSLADYDGVLVTLPVPEASWASLEIEGKTVPVR